MTTESPLSPYEVSLLSPLARALISGVHLVSLPGLAGRLGVMRRHEATIVALKPGIVHFYDRNDVIDSYFIQGGMADVTPEGCLIMTDRFDLLTDLDPRLLQEDLLRYHNDLAGLVIEEERRLLHYKIALTEAKLAALKKRADAL